MVDHQRLVEVLVDFSRNLVADYDITAMLDQLCTASVQVLPANGAGVMLADEEDDLRFVAASNDDVRTIESLQVEYGEGPCVHAYRTGEQVVVPDLTVGARFPRFAPRALVAGLRGVYSFPMRVTGECVGALNFYSAEPHDFSDEDRTAGEVLANVATSYILNARALESSHRLTRQLQHALDTRIVVEQAKGKLAEQLGVSVEEAFERLRAHARRNGLRVHNVARDVVEGRLRIGRGGTRR